MESSRSPKKLGGEKRNEYLDKIISLSLSLSLSLSQARTSPCLSSTCRGFFLLSTISSFCQQIAFFCFARKALSRDERACTKVRSAQVVCVVCARSAISEGSRYTGRVGEEDPENT